MRSICSLTLLVVSMATFAQDTTQMKERQKWNFKPYELKVGLNMVRSIRTFAGSGFTSHELESLLSFERFVLALDLGFQETHRTGGYEYINDGNYFRFGFSRSFVKNKEGGNTISLGLRYARANFQDKLIYLDDSVFGPREIILENPNLRAQWLELVFDMRGKLSGNLFIGLTTRWQFLRSIKGEGPLLTYDVPGFGTTQRPNSTAFDYYIMWRIPFKKNL